MMRYLITGAAVALSLLGTSAYATDLPSMAAPTARAAPRASAASWNGWYLGGNLGYSWGRSKTDTTIVANTTQLFSNSTNLNGWLGGLQIGHNWQRPDWIFGVEADIQLTGQKGTTGVACGATLCNNSTAVGTALQLASASLEQKLPWFGTVRGRIGPMMSPTSWVYFTGGLAWGRIKSEGTLTGVTAGGATTTAAFSSSSTKLGWTIGAGIEGQVATDWTAKLEYLYMDLGSVSFNGALPTNAPPLTAAFSSKITDNILRIGLNYQFK